MDQETLISAIGVQLDALSSLLSATIALALVAGWAGLQGSAKVTVFSVEFDRRGAFYILAAGFILVNVTCLIYFLRLADLLALVDEKHFGRAITALGTHPWAYNPYAHFGSSLAALLHSGFGFGVMIVIWWIGYTTLSLLTDFPPKKALDLIVMGAFLAVGLASMGAIHRVFHVISSHLLAHPDPSIDVDANLLVRSAFTFAGIGIGGLIFAAAQRLRKRPRAAEPRAPSPETGKGPSETREAGPGSRPG